MKKRLFRIFLIATLLTILFVSTASAETYTGSCGSSATWTLDTDSGELRISGTGNMDWYSNGFSGTPWCAYQTSIKTIVVEEGITLINKGAFYTDYAGIQRISIPSSVTSIHIEAIGCVGEIVVAENNRYYSVKSGALVRGNRLVKYPANSAAASYCVPEGIAVIEARAFHNAKNLVSVELPDGVTEIGDYGFYYCTKLRSITIPDSVTKLGDSALRGCRAMETLVLPDSITSIGTYAVASCSALKEITIPAGLTALPDWFLQYGTSLTDIVIPDTITTIGDAVFANCSSLTSIVVPDTVTTIGDGVFADCSSLKHMVLPEMISSLGSGIFKGCTELENVSLPNGITSIPARTFKNCKSLKRINIPESVTLISVEAFYGCEALGEIQLPTSLTEIDVRAFYLCYGLTEITLPRNVDSVTGIGFAGCRNLNAIHAVVDNPYYSSVDGVLYSKDGSALVLYPQGRKEAAYSIQDGVATIKTYAFYHNNSLTKIYIPASVQTLEKSAFCVGTALTGLFFYGAPPTAAETPTYGLEPTDVTVYYLDGTEGWGETWFEFPTAKWSPEIAETYTVTYNLNGGSETWESQTKFAGLDLNLHALTPYREGFTFLGWGLRADAAEAVYQPGDVYAADADLTLYAIWQAKTCTITFDANGGENAPAAVSKTYGTAITLPDAVPVRANYTFLGWSTSPSAVRASYSAGGAYSGNSNTTLYAVWQAVTYSVAYDANGGSGAPAVQTKTAGTELTLSETVPVWEGFTFLGWAVEADAKNAAYQPGDAYTADAAVTLYAVWQQDLTGNDAVVTLSAAAAAPGNTVILTASISGNQGLAGYLFEVRADQNVFSVGTTEDELHITAGEVCQNGTLLSNASDKGWKIMWYNTTNVKADGVLFTIELTVAEDAPDGAYPVELICSYDDTVNVEGTTIPLLVENGTVTVTSGVKGDVNGDGKVTNADVIRLARSLVDLVDLTEDQLVCADVTGDGKVTNSDVIKLARSLIGLVSI